MKAEVLCRQDNEVGTCTQRGFRNGLGETTWQSGNLNVKELSSSWPMKRTPFSFVLLVLLPYLLPVGCDRAQRWQWMAFKRPFQAWDLMPHILPLFRDVTEQEVQVNIYTSGREAQNVIDCFSLS